MNEAFPEDVVYVTVKTGHMYVGFVDVNVQRTSALVYLLLAVPGNKPPRYEACVKE
jgi:hypothetical protein